MREYELSIYETLLTVMKFILVSYLKFIYLLIIWLILFTNQDDFFNYI